jgi:hypothetical protein
MGRTDDMILDHAHPVHLFFGKFPCCPSLFAEKPFIKVAICGFFKRCEHIIDAGDAPDQGYEGDELAFRRFAVNLFYLFKGSRDMHSSRPGFALLQLVQQFLDHLIGNMPEVVRLMVKNGKSCNLILMGFYKGFEIGYGVLRILFGLLIPSGVLQLIDVDTVNDLLMRPADPPESCTNFFRSYTP